MKCSDQNGNGPIMGLTAVLGIGKEMTSTPLLWPTLQVVDSKSPAPALVIIPFP